MTRTSGRVALLAIAVGAAACSLSAQSPMDRGVAYYRNGLYLQARDAFDEAVRRSPRSAAAYNNRAVARFRIHDQGGALEDYTRAIALDPSDADIHFNRGNALIAAGRYGAAVDDFTRATTLRPAFARAYFNRGTAHAYLAMREAALADWRRAVELEPDPWTRGAMTRAAGLDAAPPLAGQPAGTTLVSPRTPPSPATVPGAAPMPAPPAPAPPQPSASISTQDIEARALATRAMSRELDGDHEGALQDLRTAIALETSAPRRDSMVRLLRLLETPR